VWALRSCYIKIPAPNAFRQEAKILAPMCSRPAKVQKNFRILGAKTSKSLKKWRAARALERTSEPQNQDSPPDNGKSEDPAKMTHSIPDV